MAGCGQSLGRHIGEECTHFVGEVAHLDGGEVVNGEGDVATGIVTEDALEIGLQGLVAQACLELRGAQVLLEIFKEEADEDTAGCRSLFLSQLNDRKDMPADGIVGEQVAEEAGDIAQLVGLVAVNGVVVLGEGLLVQLHPHAVQARKLLAQQAHELGIDLLLRA